MSAMASSSLLNEFGPHTYPERGPRALRVSGDVDVTEDGFCFGQIKGDPDIAGWGVFISVLLNALISVILSFLVFWIPYAKTRWQKQRNGPVTQSVDSHTESEAEAEEELTPVENLVLTLCDLNLVTSLGLIISSLSKIAQDNQYPLYHIFLARSLANLAILGHNASSFVYKKMRSCKKWSLYLRWFLSAVAVVLYLCWSAITLHRFEAWESRDGRSYTPECFSTHRYTFPMPGSMRFWIWVNIFWIPSGYIWILAYPFSDVIHNALVGLDDLTVWMLRKLSETKFAVSNPRRTLKKVLSLALQVAQVLLMVALVALWFHLNLLLPADLVTPITYFVFGIAWNGYDICAIKRSNLNAVVGVLQTASPAESTNPETEFGIGQILPIIMILQVVLSLLDVLADILNKQENRDAAWKAIKGFFQRLMDRLT